MIDYCVNCYFWFARERTLLAEDGIISSGLTFYLISACFVYSEIDLSTSNFCRDVQQESEEVIRHLRKTRAVQAHGMKLIVSATS